MVASSSISSSIVSHQLLERDCDKTAVTTLLLGCFLISSCSVHDVCVPVLEFENTAYGERVGDAIRAFLRTRNYKHKAQTREERTHDGSNRAE